MIKGYEYKILNNEKVLILYLNYDSEFGLDFKFNHKNSSMKKEIKKYIKKNKIELDGEKIALSIGGIILAVLLVTQTPSPNNDLEFAYVSDNIITTVTEVVVPSQQEDKEEVVDNKPLEEVKEDNNKEIVENKLETNKPSQEQINKPNTSEKSISNNQFSIDKNNNQVDTNINNTPNNSSSSQLTQSTENNQTPPKDNNEVTIPEKLVTVYRSNDKVITLSMEEYLIGVVGAEMPASFSKEALKAQAVVSRTYALKKIENGGKLTDSVSTQRYKDIDELKKDWGSSFDKYYEKIKNAVLETKDLAIYYQGKYIDAVYHSTSNGKTEDAKNVWGNSVPYLKSVDSSWDKEASSYIREISKELSEVLSLLGISDNINELQVLSRNDSDRVLEIRVGDSIYSGVDFRNLLGLRSTDFDISLSNNNLIITTRGYGHGVGLSQYGANGMAKEGYTYREILNHYYTDVSIY